MPVSTGEDGIGRKTGVKILRPSTRRWFSGIPSIRDMRQTRPVLGEAMKSLKERLLAVPISSRIEETNTSAGALCEEAHDEIERLEGSFRPRHYLVLLAVALLVIWGLAAKLGWTLAELDEANAVIKHYRSLAYNPGR